MYTFRLKDLQDFRFCAVGGNSFGLGPCHVLVTLMLLSSMLDESCMVSEFFSEGFPFRTNSHGTRLTLARL